MHINHIYILFCIAYGVLGGVYSVFREQIDTANDLDTLSFQNPGAPLYANQGNLLPGIGGFLVRVAPEPGEFLRV
jgi:hypothetical protein